MPRLLRWFMWGLIALVAVALLWMVARAMLTRNEIDTLRDQVHARAASTAAPRPGPQALAALPAPVQRWVAYTFRGSLPDLVAVDYTMEGQFRRPGTQDFQVTTARQVAAIGVPAMVFDATTPVLGVLWARAYDAYLDGHMTMRAALLSAFTVVNEVPSPKLDRISLRRWMIESAMYPAALLPGGPVHWEPVDDAHARAVIGAGPSRTTLIARFADNGRLMQFDAEEDGQLDTPYHGSGEQLQRDDDRLVQGQMIPHWFRVSRVGRAGQDRPQPFWEGRVTSIRFTPARGAP